MRRSLPLAVFAAAALPAIAAAPVGAVTSKGPATAVDPYVLPIDASTEVKSLLTVGESVPKVGGGTYRMVGIPDGLGATPRRQGRFDLLMNHELGTTAGAVRAHGQKGAFVSKWRMNGNNFNVENGQDLVKSGQVSYFNYDTGLFQATASTNFGGTVAFPNAFARFCSGYLSYPGQFLLPYNPAGTTPGVGYSGQLYFMNEESGDNSRLFVSTVDGDTEQLPRTGLFSWENSIVAPTTKVRTVVMGLEDGPSDGSQLWLYMGDKQATGSPATRAGLQTGLNYVIDTLDETVSTDAQFRTKFGKGNPAPVDLAQVDWNQAGGAQNVEAKAKGLSLSRVEDGVFNPNNRNEFFFVTTSGGGNAPNPEDPAGTTRDGGGLWKLTFVNVNRPELGATLTLLLDGTESDPYLASPDNVGIDRQGNLLIQEDPGNNRHLAKIIAYNVNTGERGIVATHDPALYSAILPATSPLKTFDEESSGIIDAAGQYGPGWWLFDVQSHNALADTELVQDGQMLAMRITNWNDVYNRPAL